MPPEHGHSQASLARDKKKGGDSKLGKCSVKEKTLRFLEEVTGSCKIIFLQQWRTRIFHNVLPGTCRCLCLILFGVCTRDSSHSLNHCGGCGASNWRHFVVSRMSAWHRGQKCCPCTLIRLVRYVGGAWVNSHIRQLQQSCSNEQY